MTNPELTKKAHLIHLHSLRFRNYILRGNVKDLKWEGCCPEPTLPQMRAMLVLHMSGPCTLKQLAFSLNISHPSASQMIDRLVDMGLVSREQNPEDRRQIILSLSDQAQAGVKAHEDSIVNQITTLLEKMEPDFVERWVELAEYMGTILDLNPDLGITQKDILEHD
ncbi:MAG: MarR family winged helix-turn-helix transcriptional regulator [Sumerlaeia bacterium]